MTLKWVGIKGMDAAVWSRVQVVVLKRRQQEAERLPDKIPTMTTAKWVTEAIRTKLRRENG